MASEKRPVREEVIQLGQDLAARLNSAAEQCHVKSADHETFLWEASIVSARVQELIDGTPPLPNLRHSVLLPQRNNHPFISNVSDITEQVEAFHSACDQLTSLE